MPTTKKELREALQRLLDTNAMPSAACDRTLAVADARAILARPARVVGYVTYYGDGTRHSTWRPRPDDSCFSLERCKLAAQRNAKAIDGAVRKLVIR